MILNKKAFTLIELLIVIAIIAIIAGVVFVALNPLQRFKDARNSRRYADTQSIVDAVRLYQIENQGLVPTGIDTNWRMLGTASSGCDISCGSSGSGSSTSGNYNYTSQLDFSLGTYSSTQWNNSNSWLELISPNTSGSYTSPVIDSITSNTVWSSLAYAPQFPTNKELPNNGQSETGYSSGDANMSGNVLLMHFNEQSGSNSFLDTSPSAVIYTCIPGTCPSSVTGKFGQAVNFDGIDDRLVTTKLSSFNNSITVSAWIKPIFTDTSSGSQLETVYLVGAQGSSGFHWLYLNRAVNEKLVTLGWQYSNSTSNNGASYSMGQISDVSNKWWHLVVTHDYAAKQIKFFINGVLVKTTNHTDSVVNVNSKPSYIGSYNYTTHLFSGAMDEFSIFNRVLSDQEVLDFYKRGATRLKLQVRSCTNTSCVGSSFIGPDGTIGSYYTELLNKTTGLPSFNFANVSNNQYFQYKTYFETDNNLYSPKLKSVSIFTTSANPGSGNLLQSTCLDLTNDLSAKLNPIPQDPSLGTSQKTYYAVSRNDTGIINAQACGAEGENIVVSR